jgi:PAS domain S-box-containing protein
MTEPTASPWKILIIDDEQEVHTVTKMVLAHFVFEGRSLAFLHAYSAAEAKKILETEDGIAVILLDVIMEEEDSGLKLIGHIRETLGNRFVRIILRTGQPGQIPEHNVIVEYDINDYKSKSELTYQKLFTSVTAALRAYDVICSLEKSSKELEREKEIISATLHSIDDAVISLDKDGRVTLMNSVAEKMSGTTFAEAAGRHYSSIVTVTLKSDGSVMSLPTAEELKTGINPASGLPAVVTPESGAPQSVITFTCAPIITAEGSVIGAIIVARDISNLLKIEDELKKAQKLESIGILAGGIAHDFNNILTGIMGNISLAKLDTPKDRKSYTYLGEAEKAVMRAQTLTRQLLSFSKGSAPVKEPVEGGTILDEAVATFLTSKFSDIHIVKGDNLPFISADKGQISQVLINILVNAFEANEGKGTITAEAHILELDERNSYGIRQGSYLQYIIRDNGPGIPEENIPKLFDPFFTTKHNGNGLGLTTAFTMIKRHGGIIVPANSPAGGTVVEIIIPSCEKPKPEEKKDEQPQAALSVLLMDDDEFIVKSVSGVLSYFGFETDSARDGVEALEKYRKRMNDGKRYSVVIMDLMIPGGMGGKEAISQLRKIDQNAVVLVSSGYSDDPIMAEHTKYGFNGVILKPYKPQDLITAIRKAASASGAKE